MYLAIVKPCNCSNSVEVGGVDEVGDDEDIFPLPRDVISSTATRRLSGSSGKQREGRIVFPSIIIIARTDKRTDGAARRTYSPGASIRGKVGCQRSELRTLRIGRFSEPSCARRIAVEGGTTEKGGERLGYRRSASRCPFGRRGKPIWCGPLLGKTAAIFVGRLSNSNPITSSVTRLSDRWH